MLAIPIGIIIGLMILLRPRWWALHFPFWYALFPKGFVLLDISGIPVVTMYRFICIALFIAMTVLELRRRRHWIKKHPLFIPMMGLLCSAAVTVLFNLISPDAGGIQLFNLFNEIVVPVSAFGYYFGQLDKSAQQKYFRSLLVFYGIISAYATIAFLINFNPYIEFLEMTTKTGRIQIQTYAETLRGLRAQGTISHPITFGAALALVLLSCACVSLDKRRIGRRIFTNLSGIILVLCIVVAVMLAKSRSPLIILAVAGLYTVMMSSFITSYIYIVTGAVLLSAAYFFIPGVEYAVLSIINIFDSSAGEAQHGSSLEMRQLQLAAAVRNFLDSPFAGNGLEATRNIISAGSEPDLYNSESLLFSVLINQGLLGLVAYIILFASLFVAILRSLPSKNTRAIMNGTVLAYLVFVLATGVMETMSLFLALMTGLILYYNPVKTNPIQKVLLSESTR